MEEASKYKYMCIFCKTKVDYTTTNLLCRSCRKELADKTSELQKEKELEIKEAVQKIERYYKLKEAILDKEFYGEFDINSYCRENAKNFNLDKEETKIIFLGRSKRL